MTVHPASEREDEELQRRRHSLRLLGRLDQHRPSLGRFFAPYGVIQNAPTHAEIDEWQNTRGTVVNTLLWFREEYLVVLARRQGYWLLRTAYCTEKSGRQDQAASARAR